jgi:serine/threonine protein kinase
MAEATAAVESAPAVSEPPRKAEPTLIGEKVGKYKVLREIGRGGMGAVYEALHESLGQRIAIKVLSDELSSDARHVQRFFDEARAAWPASAIR